MSQINNTFLTNNTGDPFADIGGYVISFFQKQEKWKDKPILDLIEYMAGIYVNQWGAGINALFLNSPVTQASFKGEQKILETRKYFRSILDGTAPYKMGFCRISGQFTQLFKGGRENYMMAGSGAFINFHHSFDDGIQLSKEVLIRLFFVPFGVRQIGSMVGVITSNVDLITEKYVEENCIENLKEIGSGKGEGVLKHPISSTTNAIFDFAGKWIREIPQLFITEDGFPIPKKQTTINLFHFTNFAAAPDIQLMTLPAEVFDFFTFCQGGKVQNDWRRFVKAHYYNSKFAKAKFNTESENWETSKETLGYDDFKNWRNRILDRLLEGKSITRFFARWSQTHSINFLIIKKYLITIRNMDKKTVEKILFLADFIVKGHEQDFIANSVKKLDACKNAFGLRRMLLKLNSDNAKNGNEPLITVDDYINYLFSDSSNWSEVRDVLIIAIYQKSHEEKIRLEVELQDDETIISETTN